MVLRFFWIATFILVIVSCNNQSSPSGPNPANPRINYACIPSGMNVSCTALLIDVPNFGAERDITTEATWLFTDPSLGTFTQPGLFVPIKRGEVGLWVRFDELEAFDKSWFLVDPNSPSRRLDFLWGQVFNEATNETIAGAEVQILDGYSSGKIAITNQFGAYTIDNILTGQSFSVRASKSGYSSAKKTYRVDSPIGPAGNAPFLNFRLRRLN